MCGRGRRDGHQQCESIQHAVIDDGAESIGPRDASQHLAP
jgi:hypothetical protein